MKWKEGVTVGHQPEKNSVIRMGEKERWVLPEHEYILEQIQAGVEDDQELVQIIARQENIPEAAAAFGLAGFLIEYADFIAPDTSHYMIE